ncbi:hypothetical protein AUO95_06540 [Corynebacterium glutamicum]|nr:hypothetical protein AUO95_06540 [Corynebacterium glutamicum]
MQNSFSFVAAISALAIGLIMLVLQLLMPDFRSTALLLNAAICSSLGVMALTIVSAKYKREQKEIENLDQLN